jgi:hypothetical protein
VNIMKNHKLSKFGTPTLLQFFSLLREQEEEKKDDEGDDDKPEDEPADDEGEDEKEDEDKEDEKDEDDEKKDDLKISAEDTARLESSIDSELQSVMVNFETDARKSAAIEAEKMKSESLRRVYRRLLYEVAADDIDLKHFAGNVARLVKNYETLLDIENIILNKSYAYIQNNYGEDTVKALKDVLEQDYGIEIEREKIEKDEPEIPIAVGASDQGSAA